MVGNSLANICSIGQMCDKVIVHALLAQAQTGKAFGLLIFSL